MLKYNICRLVSISALLGVPILSKQFIYCRYRLQAFKDATAVGVNGYKKANRSVFRVWLEMKTTLLLGMGEGTIAPAYISFRQRAEKWEAVIPLKI